MAKVYDDYGNLVSGVNTVSYTGSNGGLIGNNIPATQTTTNMNAPNQSLQWKTYTPQKLGVAPPTYKGLMDGDYEALQKALAVKGNQGAQNAWNTGTQNLINTMGGKGLYGSSIMQQQQTQGLDRELMNALAANEAAAASARYGFQQQDLMKGADIDMTGWQGLMSENMGINQINATNALEQNRAGLQLANTGLMGANALDVAKLNEAARKYETDQQLLARKGDNLTQLEVARMNNATSQQNIQAQVDAAKAQGNLALATSIARAAGYVLGNDGQVIRDSLSSLWGNIAGTDSSLGLFDYLNPSNY